ncbi:hypothetical protein L218DRAFT_954489 [Marasmius fiardii PR-910]|nr:hypothetical protein L218DRAFT_954489 [Marasmius fiardii PR-910]
MKRAHVMGEATTVEDFFDGCSDNVLDLFWDGGGGKLSLGATGCVSKKAGIGGTGGGGAAKVGDGGGERYGIADERPGERGLCRLER